MSLVVKYSTLHRIIKKAPLTPDVGVEFMDCCGNHSKIKIVSS